MVANRTGRSDVARIFSLQGPGSKPEATLTDSAQDAVAIAYQEVDRQNCSCSFLITAMRISVRWRS